MPNLQFRIPEAFESGFVTLLTLEDKQFDQLKAVLQSTKLGETQEALGEALAAALTLDSQKALVLAATIVSLYWLFFGTNGSVTDISAGLELAFRSAPSDPREKMEAKLRERIAAILSLESNLFYTVKSLALFDESGAVFMDCRIITDIRLTFDNRAVKEGYKGGTVVHNLKLGFREDGDPLHFMVSCHGSDLKKLRAAIDRALEKEELILGGDLGKYISFIEKK